MPRNFQIVFLRTLAFPIIISLAGSGSSKEINQVELPPHPITVSAREAHFNLYIILEFYVGYLEDVYRTYIYRIS